MNTGSNEDGFVQLWPTALLTRTLPGHEAANRVLAQHIESLDRQSADLTTDYMGNNLFASDHPAIKWLKECIDRSAYDYLRNQGVDYPVHWTLQGWPNVNRLGDYHGLHNHPHAYLSGTYYVAVPEQDSPLGQRQDATPGAISFYDPRPQANMSAIAKDGEINAEHLVVPTAGMIMLWPAWLQHFIHPNHSESPRISISFNATLKWSDDYIPSSGRANPA